MNVPQSAVSLSTPLTLPNGAIVPNRIAKAAMEENMADGNQLPAEALLRLYGAWASGGAGLILSGNVMVDPSALTGPGCVVLDQCQPIEPFIAWARAARSGGGQAWLQINHPGRQVFAAMGQQAVAPSAIGVEIAGRSHLFSVPRALSVEQIDTIIARFATTAKLAELAGFTGVQIHAAHGYLLSQFLSPLTNRRTDEYGGILENRARLLLDVIKAVRGTVLPDFCVAVKLNSADFQIGGFDATEAAQVVGWLNDLPVDLVELSGGSYESPAMQGKPKSAGSIAREAYFINFAREIALVARMPIMVTGGIKRRAIAELALLPDDGRPGVAMVGIASAMAFEPALPRKWQNDERLDIDIPKVGWRNKSLAGQANAALIKVQLRRMGNGRAPKPDSNPLLAAIGQLLRTRRRTKRYRTWISVRRGTRKELPEMPSTLS